MAPFVIKPLENLTVCEIRQSLPNTVVLNSEFLFIFFRLEQFQRSAILAGSGSSPPAERLSHPVDLCIEITLSILWLVGR